MRSIKYVITGNPKNQSDCFDYCNTISEVLKISLELGQEELYAEDKVVFEFFGFLNWEFVNGKKVSCRHEFGGLFYHETEERKKTSIKNANRRLEEKIKSIEKRLSLIIINKEQKIIFQDPFLKN